MIVEVIFWVMFVLACVGTLWGGAPAPYARASGAFLLICVGILGYKVVSFH